MPVVNYSAQLKKMTKTDDDLFSQDYNMDLFSQFDDMSFAVENPKQEEIADFLTKDFC